MLMAWGKWRANRAFIQGDLSRAALHLKNGEYGGKCCDRRLSRKLSRALAERAERHITGGNLPAAWVDLSAASDIALAGDQDWLSRHKTRLVELTIETADGYLSAGKITQALSLVRELQSREILDWRSDRIAKTARLIQSADDSAARGHLKTTTEHLSLARNLRPDLALLDARQKATDHRQVQLKTLTRKLEKSLLKNDWKQVDQLCSDILLIAPNYQVAIDARKQLVEHQRLLEKKTVRQANGITTSGVNSDDVHDIQILESTDRTTKRFLLWIDSVGGYLVCPSDKNIIGAAIPQANIEIPIMADLRRRHVRIDRVDGGYMIDPLSHVSLNGKVISEPTPLTSGQTIHLDEGVRLVYDQPHPLSNTARISFSSRHRTQPWSDGVLLVGDTILMGPDPRNHIWCPKWSRNLVLFLRDGKWVCRADQRYSVDGKGVKGEASVQLNSRIVGSDFSISLEPIA